MEAANQCKGYEGRRWGGLPIIFDRLGFLKMHVNPNTRVFLQFVPVSMRPPRLGTEPGTSY